MKKLIIAGFIALTPLAANASGGSAGCGLGSQLFAGQSGLGPNVLAATTNGSFGNNTFGMSSGTLGCNQNDTVTAAAGEFINKNMESVARDMSTGKGESLETLATLMGIEKADRAEFFHVSQANFTSIYSRDNVTSSEVIAALKSVMQSDAVLSKYVS